MTGLAGCGGGDGGGGGGEEDTNGGEQTGDGDDGDGIEGIESVRVENSTVIVTKAEESDVGRVQLFDPDAEPVGMNPQGFNTITQEAEIGLSKSLSEGEYTLVAFNSESGDEVGRQTVTLEVQFEVIDTKFMNRRHDRPFIAFKVKNIGDIPMNVKKLEIVESTGTGGFTRARRTFSGIDEIGSLEDRYSTSVAPGKATWVFADNDLVFVNEESGSDAEPCSDWQAETTYRLTGPGDKSTTVDVTIDFGSEYKKLDGPSDPVYCKSGEVVDFSSGASN